MKLHLIFLQFVTYINCDDVISYYEYIIEKQLNESVAYQYPSNAYNFIPYKPTKIKDFGDFDFIIIGAGSTGTVIANRLTEIDDWKVLLLEAGPYGDNVTDIPEMTSSVRLSKKFDWGFKTIPQETACLDSNNQQCRVPRGRGVGGSSLINGLVYTRCNKLDYDEWAAMGNPGWSYKDVLPYFKKSEELRHTDPNVTIDLPFRGTEGYIATELPIPRHPLSNAWLEANQERNFPIVDYNGEEQLGAAITQINTRQGVRSDGGNSYIKPFLDRKNLKVSTDSFVTKIVISDSNAAEGVEFVRKGQRYFARACKDVILSAGAISSPQILMLSGIGPREHLHKMGIRTRKNLEVGTNYKDHAMFFGLSFSSNLSEMQQPLSEYIKQYLKGTGSMSNPTEALGIGFYRSTFSKEASPDIELSMFSNYGIAKYINGRLREGKESLFQHLDDTKSFKIYVTGLHPKSVGSIRLKSRNPFDYPLIDTNCLSDPENHDIDVMYDGIQLVLNLTKTEAFKKINASVVEQHIPACRKFSFLSKEYWYCLLRHLTSMVYHPTTSCRMGPSPKDGAVVNSECKVHGFEKLRVADGSVIPLSLSGHPNAVCVMIGEKVSEIIKKQYLKIST